LQTEIQNHPPLLAPAGETFKAFNFFHSKTLLLTQHGAWWQGASGG
jgi:hypothetical protein